MFTLNCKGRLLLLEKPVVMGIINLTPDSFYSGSRQQATDAILAAAEKMLKDGAMILDLGAQSTRPGSERVTEEEELNRLLTALEALSKEFPEAFISVDTFYAAVAKAAVESGVAQQIPDWNKYEEELHNRLGSDDNILKVIINKAKQYKQKVVFADAENFKTLKAAQLVRDEGIAIPILLGNVKKIENIANENGLEIDEIEIIDPKSEENEMKRHEYGEKLFDKRNRKGYNIYEAKKIMRERNYFGCMMVQNGEADALITGLTRKYPDTLRPVLEIIGVDKKVNKLAGMYVMLTKKGPICFADTTINEFPTVQDLVDITMLAAENVSNMNIKPKVAMLSYSNFGSSHLDEAKKVKEAVKILHERYPDLVVDGEIQGSVAFNNELLKENYPFSSLVNNSPNILIFPNLAAGNIAYHLMMELGNSEAVGPILLGLNKSVHVLQLGSTVRQIVNMVAIAAVDAYVKRKGK